MLQSQPSNGWWLDVEFVDWGLIRVRHGDMIMQKYDTTGVNWSFMQEKLDGEMHGWK